MGRTILQNTTLHDVTEQVLKQELASSTVRILKHSIRGRCLWYLAHTLPTDEKWIGLVLIDAVGAGAFGVKHLDETMGPTYYDCPLGWLDECSEPYNDYAKKWRETVRSKAQAA